MAIKKFSASTTVLNSIAVRVKAAKEERVPLNSIKPWADNMRVHDADNIKKLGAVLKQFGQVTPVIVYTRDNCIRKGNGTWESLKHIGASDVLIKRVDFGSKAIADAYGLADNKAPEWSDWDQEALTKYFNGEEYKSHKLEVGFTEKEILMFNLSEQLPENLPEVDLSGVVSGKTKFIVVVFDKDEEEELENIYKVLNFRSNQKTINWKDLKKYSSGEPVSAVAADEEEEL